MKRLLLTLAVLAGFTGWNLPAQTSGSPDRAIPTGSNVSAAAARASDWLRIHDPSTVLRCGDEFWLFSTGTGVVSRHSKDLKNWFAGPPVFATDPKWFQDFVPGHRGHLWAPDVMLVEGRYLLYYSISLWGKNTSAIALASSPTLDPTAANFGWKDEGVVIHSVATNHFNTIDPALFRDDDGKLWLAFGSYWTGIKLIELNPKTGKRIAPDSPVHSLAWNRSIEAAAIIRHGANYFLFVNWGQCCKGVDSTYEIRVGRSDRITGPYRDREGKDLLQGGGSVFLQTEGCFIGPGHVAAFNVADRSCFSFHYYDAKHGGAASLAIRELEWDDSGWPRAGAFLFP